PFPNPGTSPPSHGTVTVDTIAATITYTNNGDGAISDSFVVEDASNNPITVNVAIAPATSPITISPATLPAPAVGTAYSQQLGASGGTAPYGFAVTGGNLPPGLGLVGDTINGTPVQAGGYNATITVADDTGATAVKAYSFSIPNPDPSITIAPPPGADVGAAYSYDLNANTTGALAPYTFTIDSGTLPPGLALVGTTITGTPTAAGTFNFAVDLRDSSPNLSGLVPGPYGGVRNLSITVQNVPPTIGPVSATVAYGSSANAIPLALGGAPATSVAVATAPANGSTSVAGTTITYTPNAGYAGPDSFTYTATNSAGTSAAATVTITVSPPTVVYVPGNPPAATAGVAYNASIAAGASGGAAPYTYAIAGGALPTGLSLAADGTISGTPLADGSFDFSVTATDSSTGTGPFSATPGVLTVSVAPRPITRTPAALPAATFGSMYSQTLVASGGTPGSTCARTGTLPTGSGRATDGTLSGTPSQAGSFNITATPT